MRFAIALILSALVLASCASDLTPDAETAGTTVPALTAPDSPSDEDLAVFAAAFASAEQAVARFTGYADHAYTDGTRMINGVRYDRCAYGSSIADLCAPLESALDATLLDTLVKKTVADGVPLYVEASDGTLWRFGGYAAQYSLDVCTRTVIGVERQADGSAAVTVEIVSTELGVHLTHTYTCVPVDDGWRFTGEFPLPVELAFAAASA